MTTKPKAVEFEAWAVCRDFPDYEVSSTGEVRRLTHGINAHPGRLVSQRKSGRGYMSVSLTNAHGVRSTAMVHRLVATAFVPHRRGSVVNHIDGDKLNNRSSNLEWCTPSENESHAAMIGLKAHGSRHGNSRLTESQVVAIRERRSKYGEPSTSLAREFGITVTQVNRILARNQWQRVAQPIEGGD